MTGKAIMKTTGRAPKTKEYTDTDGKKYKVCDNCGKKIYYQEWFNEKAAKNAPKKGLPHFWQYKKYCSKRCQKEFWKLKRDEFKYCLNCGEKFYRPGKEADSTWERRKLCTKQCSLEYGWISRLASTMNVEFDYLKKKLIEIAEEYHAKRRD